MVNYQNPYLNPYGFSSIPPPPQQTQVVRVNGENGARAYNLGANSSALLLDESGLMVWLVTTDGAGYKSTTPYDITPHQVKQAPDYGSLETRIQKLEEIINGSADSSAIRRRNENTATNSADDEHGSFIQKSTGSNDADYPSEPRNEGRYGYHSGGRK